MIKTPDDNNKKKLWFIKEKNKQGLMLLILFLLFGIVVSNHVRSVQSSFTGNNLNTRYAETQKELAKLEETYQLLLQENEQLMRQRDEAIDTILSRQGYDELSEQINRARVLAGFTEVRGEGVIITLDDKPDYDILRDPVASIIHDGNIRHVLNMMINNGAAAISINGIRIVNNSYIYCAGPTITCNRERMTPPYVITVLGPADRLENVFIEDQLINQLKVPEIGIIAQVRKSEDIYIPPFAEADNIGKYIDLLEVVKNEN